MSAWITRLLDVALEPAAAVAVLHEGIAGEPDPHVGVVALYGQLRPLLLGWIASGRQAHAERLADALATAAGERADIAPMLTVLRAHTQLWIAEAALKTGDHQRVVYHCEAALAVYTTSAFKVVDVEQGFAGLHLARMKAESGALDEADLLMTAALGHLREGAGPSGWRVLPSVLPQLIELRQRRGAVREALVLLRVSLEHAGSIADKDTKIALQLASLIAGSAIALAERDPLGEVGLAAAALATAAIEACRGASAVTRVSLGNNLGNHQMTIGKDADAFDTLQRALVIVVDQWPEAGDAGVVAVGNAMLALNNCGRLAQLPAFVAPVLSRCQQSAAAEAALAAKLLAKIEQVATRLLTAMREANAPPNSYMPLEHVLAAVRSQSTALSSP